MRFVDNDPSLMSRLDEKKLALIATQFREIHCGPPMKRREEVGASTLISERRDTLNAYIKATPLFFLQRYALTQLDSLTSLIKQTHYCHNDVNPNNVLSTADTVYFIDWECAGVNDPFLDLATMVVTLRLKPFDAEMLLFHYLGRNPSNSEQQHFICMQQIALLRFAISFAANMNDPKACDNVDIASIPAFNEYEPSDGKLDKASDLGKFYISVMLIKQAMQVLNDYTFKAGLESTDANKLSKQFSFGHYQIPYFIMGGIINYLHADNIRSQRLLCSGWKLFIDEHVISPSSLVTTSTINQISNSKAIASRLSETLNTVIPWHVGNIKTLSGGLSPFCQNFLLEAYNQKYVIKVLEEDSPQGWLEMYAALSASHQGIGPRMEYFSAVQKVAVFEYVANDPRWPLDKSLDKLASLSSVIKALHGISLPKGSVSCENSKFIQLKDKVLAVARNNTNFNDFLTVISLYEGLDHLLNQGNNASLCHYDMNPWNILCNAKGTQFSLIDWEFTRIGNPLFDLATIANFLRLNTLEETFLRIAYAKGRITPLDEASYFLTKAHVYLRYAICSLGLNTSYELNLSQELLSLLPPFNQFDPFKLKIDKNTNEGRYYIAQMFIKAAMNLLMDKQFESHLKIYRQGFNTDYIPSFFVSSLNDTASEYDAGRDIIKESKSYS
jgi:thiamine kinase-like enzyme